CARAEGALSKQVAGKEGCESPEADGWGASAKGAQPRVAARPSAVSPCFAPMSSRAATPHCIAPTPGNGLCLSGGVGLRHSHHVSEPPSRGALSCRVIPLSEDAPFV